MPRALGLLQYRREFNNPGCVFGCEIRQPHTSLSFLMAYPNSGSNRLHTMPDGQWLNFGGNSVDPLVNVLTLKE
jgi:hypothetical protein